MAEQAAASERLRCPGVASRRHDISTCALLLRSWASTFGQRPELGTMEQQQQLLRRDVAMLRRQCDASKRGPVLVGGAPGAVLAQSWQPAWREGLVRGGARNRAGEQEAV